MNPITHDIIPTEIIDYVFYSCKFSIRIDDEGKKYILIFEFYGVNQRKKKTLIESFNLKLGKIKLSTEEMRIVSLILNSNTQLLKENPQLTIIPEENIELVLADV